MLDIGEQIVQKSDTRSLSEPYWICTTKRFFEEVRYAQAVQNDEGMHIAVDVTYRLSSTNNNLGFLGTTTNVLNEDRVSSYSFVPFIWFFCATEATVVYEAVFNTLKKWTKIVHGTDLVVKYIQQDHCAASAAAADICFPGAIIADCYPHLIRKCKENRSLLKDPTLLSSIMEDVNKLHLAHCTEFFRTLSTAIIKNWQNNGEHEYAQWFQKVYLHRRWCNFNIGSLPIGVQPDNNSLESLNRVIKNWIGTSNNIAVLLKV